MSEADDDTAGAIVEVLHQSPGGCCDHESHGILLLSA